MSTVIKDKCSVITIRELFIIRDVIDHLPFVVNVKVIMKSMCVDFFHNFKCNIMFSTLAGYLFIFCTIVCVCVLITKI